MLYDRQPENFHPVFEVVGCFVNYNGKFLLVHRLPHKPEGNTYGIVAGKIDKGETTREAMMREIEEESGMMIDANQLIMERTLYVRYPDKDFTWYLFSVTYDSQPDIRLQPQEHDAYVWVDPEEAVGLNLIPDLRETIVQIYEI